MKKSYFQNSNMDREDFEEALKKGLGRAKLQIINNGLSDFSDLVLNACLQEQTYDPQCESSRAEWLFEMFNKSPHYSRFREKILSALLTETDYRDLEQLFCLGFLIASSGDSAAKTVLRNRALQIAAEPSSYEWMGAKELLKIDNEAGLFELSKNYGKRLLKNPDDFVPDDLDFLIEERKDVFIKSLKEQAKSDHNIMAYLKYLEKQHGETLSGTPLDREEFKTKHEESKRKHHARFRHLYPIHLIIENAKNEVGKYPGTYMSFGRHASPEELEEIFNMLINEPKDSVRTRFLWVFRRAVVPRLDSKLFEWASSQNIELKSAAISALSQVSDKKIYEFGKEILLSHGLSGGSAEAIRLFINNYSDDIPQLLFTKLKDLKPDEHEAHDIGFSIINLADQNNDPELCTLLNWVYETTPCTNCRYKAVVHLERLQKLDETIIYECKFDASEEIRDFALKLV